MNQQQRNENLRKKLACTYCSAVLFLFASYCTAAWSSLAVQDPRTGEGLPDSNRLAAAVRLDSFTCNIFLTFNIIFNKTG